MRTEQEIREKIKELDDRKQLAETMTIFNWFIGGKYFLQWVLDEIEE